MNRRRTRSGSIPAVRFFTPDEANQALTRVRPIAEQLVRARRESAELERRLETVRERVRGNGGGLDPEQVGELHDAAAEAAARVVDLVEDLNGLGVEVKDPDTGLLDFPARHPDGSDVLLCWRVGEDSVAYWHTLDGGFAGRRPLPF